MQNQDQRIEKLEKQIIGMTDHLNSRIDHQAQQQAEANEALTTQVRTKVGNIRDAMNSIQTTFAASLQEALKVQSTELMRAIKSSRPSPLRR